MIRFVIVLATWCLLSTTAFAHCDTLDGPVVLAAKSALEKNDLAPVLKWVKAEHEAELKNAFDRTVTVRAKGKEARDLADQFFFETLVRLHRQGEGAAFTGLKPVGTITEPAIEQADKAIETGKIEPLIMDLSHTINAGVRSRFYELRELQKCAEHNIESGRAYVTAYVEFIHYIEDLESTARKESSHAHTGSAQQQDASIAEHEH